MTNRYTFPAILGLTDGIVTSLMIATNEILSATSPHFFLYIRIALGSASVGAVSFFLADYSTLKQDLVRLSKIVNPNTPFELLQTQLGRSIIKESIFKTLLSALAGFGGALIPLTLSTEFVGYHLISLLGADLSLALLGVLVARVQSGKYYFWPPLLALVGVIMIFIGRFVNIVG